MLNRKEKLTHRAGNHHNGHARKEAVKAMKNARYDRIAVYGNVAVQIMVNTLVLIAGKRQKIRVFSDRVEALRWLKDED